MILSNILSMIPYKYTYINSMLFSLWILKESFLIHFYCRFFDVFIVDGFQKVVMVRLTRSVYYHSILAYISAKFMSIFSYLPLKLFLSNMSQAIYVTKFMPDLNCEARTAECLYFILPFIIIYRFGVVKEIYFFKSLILSRKLLWEINSFQVLPDTL